MKKIFAAGLTLVLVLLMFSGCGANRQYDVASSAVAMDAAAPAASAAPAAMAETAIAGGGVNGSKTAMQNSDSGAMAEEQLMQAEPEMDDSLPSPEPPSGGVAGPAVEQVIDSRKIIKNADMQIQTLSFDSGVEYIGKATESFGGFVQNSSVEGRDMYNERGTRTATFSVRIPAEKLDSFINSLGGNDFNIISKSQYSDDITENYYDSKARLDALKVQEERLLSMLQTAGELEYMLQVEKELMNVRYEIESLTSALNRMNNYVSMSTVNIILYEVIKYEPIQDVPVTFGERISRAFTDSIENFSDFSQDFAVGTVVMLPFIVLIIIIILIVIYFIRRSNKRRAAKALSYQNQMYNQNINQQVQNVPPPVQTPSSTPEPDKNDGEQK